MQDRKKDQRRHLCHVVFLGLQGENYGKPTLVLFFPPQLEEGPTDKRITSNLVSQHTFQPLLFSFMALALQPADRGARTQPHVPLVSAVSPQ